MKSEVKYDLSKLNTFVKGMSGRYAIRVGIFGSKDKRKKGGNSNATLGAKHEFGVASENIPARSFLRMPLAMKGAQIVKEAKPYGAALLAQGKLLTFLQRIGVACENAVQMAFATHGFGMWKPNAPATIRRKRSDSPLIDTAQLRRSIASKVVKVS